MFSTLNTPGEQGWRCSSEESIFLFYPNGFSLKFYEYYNYYSIPKTTLRLGEMHKKKD